MTALIRPRFPEELIKAVESTAPGTEVHKIHDNWKIARYEPGQSFPAHFDQVTSLNIQGQGGPSGRIVRLG